MIDYTKRNTRNAWSNLRKWTRALKLRLEIPKSRRTYKMRWQIRECALNIGYANKILTWSRK